MTGVLRRENAHPNGWVDLRDKSDCWIKRREGDVWDSNPRVYRREGSGWNQIYPQTSVFIADRVVNCGGNVAYKNDANSKWFFDGTARQGSWSSYGKYGGFCDISGSSFEGSGNILNVELATFSATRNGSGYYNNNQNIYFYRSEQNPTVNGGAPYGYAGGFVSYSGAPGSGGRMTDRGFLNWDTGGKQNIIDFLNCVNGKNWLHIGGTNITGDYLGMSAISLKMSYWFSGTYRVLAAPKPVLMMSYMGPTISRDVGDPYESLLIYPGEEKLSLDEIYERRELLGLKDIDEKDVVDMNGSDIKFDPTSGEYTANNGKFAIDFFNMYDTRALYYSYDNISWDPATMDPSTGKYTMPLPTNINKIYLKVVDFITDELLYTNEKEISQIEIVGETTDMKSILSDREYYEYNK